MIMEAKTFSGHLLWLTLALCLYGPFSAQAQTPYLGAFGGHSFDRATANCLTDKGTYILAGDTLSYGARSWDFLLSE